MKRLASVFEPLQEDLETLYDQFSEVIREYLGTTIEFFNRKIQ